MHEYSLVASLLDEVVRQAEVHHASAVHLVRVRVGELAGVDPELLRTAFEVARSGTVCATAELSVVTERAIWQCPRCGARPSPGAALRCALCGVPARLESGRDLVLERLELEVRDV